MTIKVEFYGNLKEKFGSINLVEYDQLTTKTIYEVIDKAICGFNKLVSPDSIVNSIIIFKNNKKMRISNIKSEIITDGDILKIYIAVSGG